MASGLDSPATTISSDSPSEPQAEASTSARSGPVENPLRRTVRVLLPLPLADAYDYSVPDGLEVDAGHFVIVPLGRRETVGVVWGEGSGEVAPRKTARHRPCAAGAAPGRAPAPLRRLGLGLHAGAARRGAAHGDERAVGARGAADRIVYRAASLPAMGRRTTRRFHPRQIADQSAAARFGRACRRTAGDCGRSRVARRVQHGGGARHGQRGLLHSVDLPRRLPPTLPARRHAGPGSRPRKKWPPGSRRARRTGGFSVT